MRVPKCTCCGVAEAAGAVLQTNDRGSRYCDPCRLEFERLTALEVELARIVTPWLEACRKRDVPEREIEDMLRHVYDNHLAPDEAAEA